MTDLLAAYRSSASDYWPAYFFGGLIAISLIIHIVGRIRNIPVELAERKAIAAKEKDLVDREAELRRKTELVLNARVGLDTMAEEKALGFPWLADAYASHFKLLDLQLAESLTQKKRPAPRAAEEVRRLAHEKTLLRKENSILRDLHAYYENLFPWLIDFKGRDLDHLIREIQIPVVRSDDTTQDPAISWLTDAEIDSNRLTRTEKFQFALDRYCMTRKTPWLIGRDYERYIGYQQECEGFRVEYFGATLGIEDLGRDLICRRPSEVRIIQCKYWASGKTIHEKHVCQVYGTAAVVALQGSENGPGLFGDHNDVSAWLYTSCTCSETAKEFAKSLRVEIRENVPLASYPMIKCNVSASGEKIYHLPFDQQYDRTVIEPPRECYATTIAEAERLGFRRAYRWRGNP